MPETSQDKSLHDLDAERACLGAMILDNSAIDSVKEIVLAADFTTQKHRNLFPILLSLHARGVSADLVTLNEALPDEASYLASLTNDIPSAANVIYYAQIVHEHAQKRNLAKLYKEFQDGSLDLTTYFERVAALRDDRRRSREVPIFRVNDIFAFSPVQYVIDPYLPAGAVVNLTAYTGTGKSVLASALTIAAMSGLPFLAKFKVQRQGPVLYFDEETPRAYLKDRLQKMGFRTDDPFFCAHFTGLKLDDERDFEQMKILIEKHNPVLVHFDTLIRFHSADENSASEMALVMGRLRELANMGPCVLVQIHQSKQGELRVRSRGSSDIVGACDLELALTVKDEEHSLLCLQSVKARMAPIPALTLRIQETDSMAGKQLEIVEAPDWTTEQTDTIKEILAEASNPMTASAIHRELQGRGVKASLNTVRARLQTLEIPYLMGAQNAKLYQLDKKASFP